MQEEDFNAIKFEMEMNSRFWGESEKSFFSYVDINSARKLTQPIYPRPLYQALGDPKMKYPTKEPKEIRLLSAYIATAGGGGLCQMPGRRKQNSRNLLATGYHIFQKGLCSLQNHGHLHTQEASLRFHPRS